MKDNLDSRKKLIDIIKKARKKDKPSKQKDLPEGYFTKCPNCQTVHLTKALLDKYYVCPSCKSHLVFPVEGRVKMLFGDNYREMQKKPSYNNPIDFPGYEEKIDKTIKKTGAKEAVRWGEGRLKDHTIVYFVMDQSFFMGSMGTYVGEQISLAFEYAIRKKLPVLGICASGGARMQEGIFSLIQMAKIMGVLDNFRKEGLLYISLLTHPTTGGVTASFALQGDINIGEPSALIGFAGPRVIKETTGEELAKGFQSSEFLMEKGFLDMVLGREDQIEILDKILSLHEGR